MVLKISAAGVNFPDHLVIHGEYQFAAEPPFTPGAEVAGWVESVGPGVTHLKEGARVLYIGISGGMAEKACVKAAACVPLPDDIPLKAGATLGMAYGTTLHALQARGRLAQGENLVVLGAAGGVGLAAVKIGKALGARVIAAASTQAKRDLCMASGADAVIDYTQEDLKARIKGLTDGQGADVVYDPVGGDFTEQALRATAWYGRYLIVGWAAGSIPKIPTNLLLLKGCEMVGVFWGSYAGRDPRGLIRDYLTLFQMYRDDAVVPHIGETYPLERAAEAIEAIGTRQVLGKVLIDVAPEAAQ